jgi:dTDP-4-amino-4,6-dideoxygalactose transaminase
MKNKNIPLAKPLIGRNEKRAVLKVLNSGNLAQGPVVAEFESSFSKFVGDRDCVAVNSGTSGLVTAVMSLGIGQGDEVIVPSFTFAASANSIALCGAKPVFIDIDRKTFNLDYKLLESLITPKTKAIMAVHLYGLCADMKHILEVAKKHNLFVIEDAAQAHLSAIDGQTAGTFGDVAVFSFYPTKNMTSGEGGMVVYKDSTHSRSARLIRNQGMEKRYHNEIAGHNFRMSDIHAAIGVEQLKKVEEWTEKRELNAIFLNNAIIEAETPFIPNGYRHVFHQYTLILHHINRDALHQFLAEKGVPSMIYYPVPAHRQKMFDTFGGNEFHLPVTDWLTESVISLPIHTELDQEQQDFIINTIFEFLNK